MREMELALKVNANAWGKYAAETLLVVGIRDGVLHLRHRAGAGWNRLPSACGTRSFRAADSAGRFMCDLVELTEQELASAVITDAPPIALTYPSGIGAAQGV